MRCLDHVEVGCNAGERSSVSTIGQRSREVSNDPPLSAVARVSPEIQAPAPGQGPLGLCPSARRSRGDTRRRLAPQTPAVWPAGISQRARLTEGFRPLGPFPAAGFVG